MRQSILALCLAGLLASPAFSETAPKQSPGNEMETAKCSDILDLFAAADPAGAKDEKGLAAKGVAG